MDPGTQEFLDDDRRQAPSPSVAANVDLPVDSPPTTEIRPARRDSGTDRNRRRRAGFRRADHARQPVTAMRMSTA